MAIKVWNALSTPQGGIDWAGLELITALLGIEDIEALVNRLLIIKTHTPKA